MRQEIEDRIGRIYEAMAETDDAWAHCEEDDLHVAFIKYIAENGPPDLSAMALEVLKTEDLDFCRWHA